MHCGISIRLSGKRSDIRIPRVTVQIIRKSRPVLDRSSHLPLFKQVFTGNSGIAVIFGNVFLAIPHFYVTTSTFFGVFRNL